MELKDYLSQHFRLSQEILEDLDNSGKRSVFSKGEIILNPGNLSKNVFFVEEGLIKMFYHKEDRLITHFFLSENNLITRSENFYEIPQKNEKSIYGLAAIENQTTVFQFPFSKIEKWSETSVEMNKVIQHILLDILKGFSNRLNSIQFENAKERYIQLLSENPEIILRAPLGDIASYLGISQPTLSVMRSQLK